MDSPPVGKKEKKPDSQALSGPLHGLLHIGCCSSADITVEPLHAHCLGPSPEYTTENSNISEAVSGEKAKPSAESNSAPGRPLKKATEDAWQSKPP